ncbi:hypothetical protein H4R35_004801 [Dimargaris xerosporica]|nr:hypothetical protein H4R35_004801 [Dimargaris xerosporica]
MGQFSFARLKIPALSAKLNPSGKASTASSAASTASSNTGGESLPTGGTPSTHSLALPDDASVTTPRPSTVIDRPPSQKSINSRSSAAVSDRRTSKSSVLRRISMHCSHSQPGGSHAVRSSVDTTRMPSEAQIYHLTLQANTAFEKEYYQGAIAAYTRALGLIEETMAHRDDLAAVEDLSCMLHSNRSMAYFMRQQLHDSLRDAEKVVQTRPSWSKGHFCKGEALLALGLFELAVMHYTRASELEPHNQELKRFAQKARYLLEDKQQGLAIYQLLPGRDIAHTKGLNLVQNKIFEFAQKMMNCVYLIVDRESKQCAVVDACWDVPGILRVVKKENLTLVAAIVTHYHFDHVGGVPPPPFDALHIRVSGLDTVLKRLPHVKAYIHEKDIPYLAESNPSLPLDRVTSTHNNFEMTLGTRTSLRFIHTPGHTEGSQCLLVNERRLFTGDTLFPTSCGRVDLAGGCKHAMQHSLQHVLRKLDSEVMVYPGHNYGGLWSTIGNEKQYGMLRDTQSTEWDETTAPLSAT